MRSCWKLPFIHKNYFSNCYLGNNKFKIKYKYSCISPNFIDKKIILYNGKVFNTIDINANMIGMKFGEFILTKTF